MDHLSPYPFMNREPTANLDDDELLHLAIEASQGGRHGDAITYLKQAVANSKSNGKALYLLAAEHAQIGLTERAIEEFKGVLALDPTLAPARFQLGLLFLVNARVQEALDTWKPLEASGEANPYRHFAGGLASLARDEFAACTASLQRGIELNTANSPLNMDMRRVLDQVAAQSSGGAPRDPKTPDAALPGQILLSAYTRTLS